jgi:hypothetical protein
VVAEAPEELEDLHAFMGRVSAQPALDWHVRDLIPEEGIALWHGQPRDMKSLCALETGLALAAGRDPFDLMRFHVKRAVRVVCVTEEDPERLFHFRAERMIRGKAAPEPGMFFQRIRRGVSFDDPAEQNKLIRWIQQTAAEFAILDPLRGFTGAADKGPADFKPAATFLRRIQNETLCRSLLIVHHDVKPLRQAQGKTRSRSHDASGGGVFSVSECPVSFRKVAWNKTVAIPEDYKLGSDPKPFEVTFNTDAVYNAEGTPRFGSWVRASAETVEGRNAENRTERERLVSVMRTKRDAAQTADEWAAAAKIDKASALPTLSELCASGLAQLLTGDAAEALGRSRRAKLYRWEEATPLTPCDSLRESRSPYSLTPSTRREGVGEGGQKNAPPSVLLPADGRESHPAAPKRCDTCGGPLRGFGKQDDPDALPAMVSAEASECGLCFGDRPWTLPSAGPES